MHRSPSVRSGEAYGEARQVAGGRAPGVQERRGATQMGLELPPARGGGSVVLGWAKLMSLGRRRQSRALCSALTGPEAEVRVRGRWVGI